MSDPRDPSPLTDAAADPAPAPHAVTHLRLVAALERAGLLDASVHHLERIADALELSALLALVATLEPASSGEQLAQARCRALAQAILGRELWPAGAP